MEKWYVKLTRYDIKYEPRYDIKSKELSYFVANFSDDLRAKVEIQAKQLIEEENMGRLILFIDGASNQRGTVLGTILKSPQGDIIPQAIN